MVILAYHLCIWQLSSRDDELSGVPAHVDHGAEDWKMLETELQCSLGVESTREEPASCY